MKEKTIFVYGTLRRGERAHALLSRARFLGEARTVAGYALIDLGAYPGLVQMGSGFVVGEIYEVDPLLLAEVDGYEGHPVLFRRVGLPLNPNDRGDRPGVEGYLYTGDAADGPRLASGDWSERASSC